MVLSQGFGSVILPNSFLFRSGAYALLENTGDGSLFRYHYPFRRVLEKAFQVVERYHTTGLSRFVWGGEPPDM